MYTRILVPLEHSRYDDAIVEHVKRLAQFCHATVLLIHVADGWAARNVKQLKLRESEEMRSDREYLERRCAEIEAAGIESDCVLAGGSPAEEIVQAAIREGCDLIAMSTHGHRFVRDLLYGSVANDVRHQTRIPVLLLRSDGARLSGEVPAQPASGDG